MILRRARMSDAPLLLAWRNDALTRQMTLTPGEVQPGEHLAWLARTLADPSRLLLIATIGAPLGTVRIDYGDEAEMSWTIAPDLRGRRLAAEMIRAAAPEGAVAWIKHFNPASQRAAAAAGFILAGDGEIQRWVRPSAIQEKRA